MTGETEAAGSEGNEAACRNCGTALSGAYCHRCGQSAHVHRSIGGLFHDIAHGVFHFEGKIWDTLPLLVLHPGVLTRRYIEGERARFISPLALFLFAVFLLFATFSLAGGPFTPQFDTPVQTADRVGSGDPLVVNTGWAALDQAVRHASENPGLLFYKIQSSAYKYAWALIPISLPFIWLLFAFRRDVGPYDHAIFATYSLSAMILLSIALSLLAAIGLSNGWILLALAIVPPLHMYRQLKEAYALNRAGALWRTFALLMAAYIVGLLFIAMLLAMGLAG